MSAPSCRRTELSPPVPAAAGVVITLAPRPLPMSPLVVHGAFRLSAEQAALLKNEVHRSIVAVVQHGPAHAVYLPFRDLVLFADDVAAAPGGVTGYFNFDVFELQGGLAAGPYHLLVSMGELVSAVVETFVE